MNIETRPIGLDDRKTVLDFLSRYPQEASEVGFANLFAWRHSHKHMMGIYKDHLLIESVSSVSGKKGQMPRHYFYEPIGREPGALIAEILRGQPDSAFESVGRQAMKVIAEMKLDSIEIHEQKGLFDYVYLVNELKNLPGKRYESKRNFIRQCMRYNPSICSLNRDAASRFLNLQERWCDMHECSTDTFLSSENLAIREAIGEYERLGLLGVCVLIGDKIEGFAIGERLSPDTYIEYFEKANTEYKGIYQLLLNEFAKALPEGVQFLNREHDLGIEGLRRAKESYHPIKLVEKYSIHHTTGVLALH